MWTIACSVTVIWDGLGTTLDFTMMRCSLALLLMLWSCESRSVAGECRGNNLVLVALFLDSVYRPEL